MEEIQAIKKEKSIAKRWRVELKLGEGGMGAVFKVRDTTRFKTFAAMKVEADISDGGVLKLEAKVLMSLQKMEFVPRLMDAGEVGGKFCFIVMTLLGPDLMAHKRTGEVANLCEQTTLRLAMATLFAIKQIHEAGWIHRDIKPGNMVTGINGSDKKNVYLIDYGMVRSFISRAETGQLGIRKARAGEQMFRGTPRYCSMNVHHLKEQGRVDDLWSWLYMLIELHQGLPWRRLTDEKAIADAKGSIEMETLLKGCPKEFTNIYTYLEKLQFADRPDYFGLWTECSQGFKRVRGNWTAPFEWDIKEREKKEKEEAEKREKEKKLLGAAYKEKPKEPEMFSALSISANRKPGDYKRPSMLKQARKIWPAADGNNFKKRILNL